MALLQGVITIACVRSYVLPILLSSFWKGEFLFLRVGFEHLLPGIGKDQHSIFRQVVLCALCAVWYFLPFFLQYQLLGCRCSVVNIVHCNVLTNGQCSRYWLLGCYDF